MPLIIPVAHDFICPWCWVGYLQTRRLIEEFSVEIEWRGYELYPEDLEWPDMPPAKPLANRPKVPSRLDLMLAAEGMEIPTLVRPLKMRTYHAHQAVAFAQTEGSDVADALVGALYEAYWLHGEAINDLGVLRRLATPIVRNVGLMLEAAAAHTFRDRVVKFDDDAYAKGVYNVPTFFIGGERFAEQPYAALQKVTRRAVDEFGGTNVYGNLEFPVARANRPYVYCNMVATIDGKTISGNRDEGVSDLGSKIDHLLMRRTIRAADAVMIGGQTLRATPESWNPQVTRRIVVTRTGNLPADHCFLLGGESYIATGGSALFDPPGNARIIRAGGEKIDFALLLARLKDLGIERLLVLGGSEINGELLQADLVDELFLTVAPKIKLGTDLPTYAGGQPLPREALLQFKLVENHVIDDEVFLRYRRSH